MKWTEQNDARLLVAIVTNSQSKIDWKAVAEFMGEDCTASAVQHRVQRLKEMAAKMSGSPAKQGTVSSMKASPQVSPTRRDQGKPRKQALPEPPAMKIESACEDEEDKVKLEMDYDENM